MITEDDIRQMAKTMHHGGCDNRDIARAVARCAVTCYSAKKTDSQPLYKSPPAMVQKLLAALRSEGWFE